MTRSPAVPQPPARPHDPADDEEEGEEEAAEDEDMPNHGGAGSDPDSDAGGDEGDEEEVEEEVMEVEEEVEEVEEEEENGAGCGEEEIEEVDEEEEAEGEEAAKEVFGEEDHGEGDEEEEQGERGSGADVPPDSPSPADEDVNDAKQEIKSEGHVEDPKLFYSSTNKSEASSMSNSLIGEVLLERETSAESLKLVKYDHGTLGDYQPPSTKDSINTEKPETLHLEEKELVEVSQKRCRDGDLDGIPEKEASNLDRHAYSQATNFEPNSSRPRSPAAGFLENSNKRPAVVCDFFARGWCIKGNSCRFLHQKDEIESSQASKETLAGINSQRDFKEDAGLKHEADQFHTSRESLTSTAEGSASLQRALVRAYGCHGPQEFQDKDALSPFQTDSPLGMKAAANSDFFPDRHRTTYTEGANIPDSGRPSFPLLREFPQKSLLHAEYVESFNVSSGSEKVDSHFNSIDGGQSITGGFISRNFLGEGKLHHRLSKLEYANDGAFSRGSPVTKNSFTPESKYCSSSSLMYSSMYQSTSTPHANDTSTADPITQYKGLPSLRDSNTSYVTKGLFNSSFHNPLSQVQPPSNSFTHNSFRSNHGSIPFATEDLGSYKRLDFERGYHGSRSSSPFSQFGPEKIQRREIAESTSVSAENKGQSLRDAWEPSMPFRSSFYCPPATVSSPGSEYDPLSDSIEPHKMTPPSLSNHHTNIDDVLRGSHSPGHNNLNLPISFRISRESAMSKGNSEYGIGGYPSSNTLVPGSGALDGANTSSIRKEKSWSPGHVIDVGNVKEMDYENNLRNQEDKGRHHKETKALKNFRACLVEFVKDLVKPAWREGHLSKDAHKMVVKKAAEKVLSALQHHQIPSTMDAINQYLSASRPKLVKLVEGYVDKYAKS